MTAEESKEGEVEPHQETPEDELVCEGPKSWKESLLVGDTDCDTRGMLVFKIGFPFLMVLGVIIVLFILYPYDAVVGWIQLTFFYLVPPAGKETIVPAGVGLGYPIWSMILTVAIIDAMCAMLIAWNYPYAKRIPFAGKFIGKIEEKGRKKFESSDSLRGGMWVMLAVITMIPFQGSGGISSAIIGRAVGMRAIGIITAVTAGAAISGFLIGVGAKVGFDMIRQNPQAALGVIFIIVTFFVVDYIIFKRTTRHSWGHVDPRRLKGRKAEPVEEPSGE